MEDEFFGVRKAIMKTSVKSFACFLSILQFEEEKKALSLYYLQAINVE